MKWSVQCLYMFNRLSKCCNITKSNLQELCICQTQIKTRDVYATEDTVFFTQQHIPSLPKSIRCPFLRWQTQSAGSWQGGTTIERWKSLRAQGHGCNTADCDAPEHLHLWGRWDFFFSPQELLCHDIMQLYSARIWDMNTSVLTLCIIALLRKSTASDFLQKIREKRASECFPGGCSSEVSESAELLEVDMEYVSRLVLSFKFAESFLVVFVFWWNTHIYSFL